MISKVVSVSDFEKFEYLNLILEISWLYFINVVISIRLFIIFVEDKVINKQIREIVSSEIIFC